MTIKIWKTVSESVKIVELASAVLCNGNTRKNDRVVDHEDELTNDKERQPQIWH